MIVGSASSVDARLSSGRQLGHILAFAYNFSAFLKLTRAEMSLLIRNFASMYAAAAEVPAIAAVATGNLSELLPSTVKRS